jgi:preprotein translocase subunit SecD
MTRWLCLLIGLLFLTFQPAWAGHSPPKIFLRIHIQTSGEGLPATQVAQVALPSTGETIMIRAMPEITERDLIAVQSDASGSVHLHFNHDGQVALSVATGQNQGRIMVVMLNGFIIYAPVIDEQITNGELVLPRQFTPKALQLLQEAAQKNVHEQNRT